jgi:hypothetical protein
VKTALIATTLLLASASSLADTLNIHRAWSMHEYHCSRMVAKGNGTFGVVEATCESVDVYHDADHIFESGFDETPWGGWRYEITGAFNLRQPGCSAAWISKTEVTLVCN